MIIFVHTKLLDFKRMKYMYSRLKENIANILPPMILYILIIQSYNLIKTMTNLNWTVYDGLDMIIEKLFSCSVDSILFQPIQN